MCVCVHIHIYACDAHRDGYVGALVARRSVGEQLGHNPGEGLRVMAWPLHDIVITTNIA